MRTAKQIIELMCAETGIKKQTIAEKLGLSVNTLSNRMKTGKFTLEEWERIGQAFGAISTNIVMTLPDGREIK